MTTDDASDTYEAVFTALAHPVRRRILLTLNFEGGELTAGAIAAMFKHAWPTTTRHLGVLVTAGLLHPEKQGRTRVYRLDRRKLALARDWLDWFQKDPNGSPDGNPQGGPTWPQRRRSK